MIEPTFVELQEKLMRYDEVSLLELLNITSEDLVARFSDVIEERFDYLLTQVDD